MKIQLVYDRPSQISTDLLVVILDSKIKLHDLTGHLLLETCRRMGKDLNEKQLKKEYFTSLDSRVGDQHVVIFSTILEPSYNVWESLKIFVARSIRMARDHGISRVCVVLNTEEAAPFIGKAVEGAILGAYTFDRYKTEKRSEERRVGKERRVRMISETYRRERRTKHKKASKIE